MNTAIDQNFVYDKKLADSSIFLASFIIVISVLFTFDFSFFDSDEGSNIEGSLYNRLKWSLLFIFSGYVAWKNRHYEWSSHFWVNPFIFILCIYCFLSVGWSDYPIVSFKRCIQYLGMIVIGVALRNTIGGNINHFSKSIFWTLFSILLVSFIVVFVDPATGVEGENIAEHAGAWKGVLLQKNAFGLASSLTLFFWFVLFRSGQLSTNFSLFSLFIILICVLMTRSSTAIVLAFLSCFVFSVVRADFIRSSMWLLRIFIVLAIFALLLLQLFFIFEARFPNWSEISSPIANFFGKSSDLTGRDKIWELMWLEIDRHVLFGAGYASFWANPPDSFMSNFFFVFQQAHNGYIDVINDLGVLGFILFVLILLFHLKNIVNIYSMDKTSAAVHTSLLVIFLVSNITESSALRGPSTLQVIMFISWYLACASDSAETKSNA